MYDPLYRLTEANYSNDDFYHYIYDKVGNRLEQESEVNSLPSTVAYTYDNANRLASVDSVSYTYDDNGNLLNDGANTYTYDSANRLSSVNSTTTYSYNGLGDRYQQTVGSPTTTYILDLNTGLTQVLDDGDTSYLYGLGRIAQSGTATEYFLGDALGSVRQLVDSGEIVLTKGYTPYGEDLYSIGGGGSAFAYTGEHTDPNGLVYLRARYYNPTFGRFMSKDTWHGDAYIPQTLNRWNYVEANPINLTDPSGYISIHIQVLFRYGFLYNLRTEYLIPGTVPNTPPLWPTQKRGKFVDLADLVQFQIWEVEEYKASGNYGPKHGINQVLDYIDLLNTNTTNLWFPGRMLGDVNFTSPPYKVRAWSVQPGLIVYQKTLDKKAVAVTVLAYCFLAITELHKSIEAGKDTIKDGIRSVPPLGDPLPVPGIYPAPIVPIIPVIPILP